MGTLGHIRSVYDWSTSKGQELGLLGRLSYHWLTGASQDLCPAIRLLEYAQAGDVTGVLAQVNAGVDLARTTWWDDEADGTFNLVKRPTPTREDHTSINGYRFCTSPANVAGNWVFQRTGFIDGAGYRTPLYYALCDMGFSEPDRMKLCAAGGLGDTTTAAGLYSTQFACTAGEITDKSCLVLW